MMASFLIVGTVISAGAAWLANGLWVDWDRNYRERHKGPPPGGNAIGYVVVIGTFFVACILSTKLLLWMG
jgi:hypothetical protein